MLIDEGGAGGVEAEEALEDGPGDLLGVLAALVGGPDARRAAVPAGAGLERLQGVVEELRLEGEEGRAEADAARDSCRR